MGRQAARAVAAGHIPSPARGDRVVAAGSRQTSPRCPASPGVPLQPQRRRTGLPSPRGCAVGVPLSGCPGPHQEHPGALGGRNCPFKAGPRWSTLHTRSTELLLCSSVRCVRGCQQRPWRSCPRKGQSGGLGAAVGPAAAAEVGGARAGWGGEGRAHWPCVLLVGSAWTAAPPRQRPVCLAPCGLWVSPGRHCHSVVSTAQGGVAVTPGGGASGEQPRPAARPKLGDHQLVPGGAASSPGERPGTPVLRRRAGPTVGPRRGFRARAAGQEPLASLLCLQAVWAGQGSPGGGPGGRQAGASSPQPRWPS